MREDHVAAQLGRDLKTVAMRMKVELTQLLRHAIDTLVRVDAGARAFQRGAVNVGGEHPKDGGPSPPPEHLGDRDRHAVRLFAGSAASDPDAQLVVASKPVDQSGQHVAIEDLERLLVAEESGHADEEIAVQRAQLDGILRDAIQVLAEIAAVGEQ